jgi:hypothetical protein
VAEVLGTLIDAYRELLRAPTLTDAAVFANYALAVLIVDEVCREVGAVPAWVPVQSSIA